MFGTLFGLAGVLVLAYTLFLFVFTDMRRERRMELAVVFLIGTTLLGASVHWLAGTAGISRIYPYIKVRF